MSNFNFDEDAGHEAFQEALAKSLVSVDVTSSKMKTSADSAVKKGSMSNKSLFVPLSSQVGRCNICCESKNLSEDHVPPKSCQKPEFNKKHWVSYVFEDSWKPRLAQGKVKFETICADCNNFLGREADTEFLALIESIRSCGLACNGVAKKFNTEKITLSLVGHLLAQVVDLDIDKPSSFVAAAREFVLSRKPHSGRSPSNLNGFKVFYSFNQQIDGYTVLTDALLLQRMANEKGKPKRVMGYGKCKIYEPYYIQVLKMPEISFFVSSTNDFFEMPEMRSGISRWLRIALPGERHDSVAKYKSWPEAAGEYVGFMMLLGASGMRATYATTTSVNPPEFTDPSPEDEAFIKLAAKAGLLIKLTKGR